MLVIIFLVSICNTLNSFVSRILSLAQWFVSIVRLFSPLDSIDCVMPKQWQHRRFRRHSDYLVQMSRRKTCASVEHTVEHQQSRWLSMANEDHLYSQREFSRYSPDNVDRWHRANVEDERMYSHSSHHRQSEHLQHHDNTTEKTRRTFPRIKTISLQS